MMLATGDRASVYSGQVASALCRLLVAALPLLGGIARAREYMPTFLSESQQLPIDAGNCMWRSTTRRVKLFYSRSRRDKHSRPGYST